MSELAASLDRLEDRQREIDDLMVELKIELQGLGWDVPEEYQRIESASKSVRDHLRLIRGGAA